MNNQKKENQVYVASLNKYVDSGDLTPKQYDELVNSYRTKQKKRRECFLPKEEYHLCEGDCASCKYHIPLISFDDTYISDKDGNVLTIGDCIAADVPDTDEIAINKVYLSEIIKRVSELLPEALIVGNLKDAGISLDCAEQIIGMPRQTYSYRLDKIRKKLALEFPEYNFEKNKFF